ncbi:hypothetical protein HOLleu_29159 [Holothuria leucospilota]|uniref:Uncharacterized protein n=1 Tax=Holothuria leucospilota TaxID=206669 RepID=A0A9Q1H149_HOLLE|nr:hypothetical protein HOLleu_29159 [Holothuria leucospilota]
MPGTNPFDNGSVSESMITLNETWADLTESDPLYSGERGQAAEESRMGEDGRPVLDVQQGEERLPDIAAEQRKNMHKGLRLNKCGGLPPSRVDITAQKLTS